MPCSWFFLNWLSVATFASGNGFSAFVSFAVFAAVTPPATFTNVNTFSGFGYSASKRCVEMVTSPYGDPPREDRVDRVLEARREPGSENGDERHEREADHQRRRGGSGALRVPHRVAAGERSGRAADANRRPPEHTRERRHERLREHRDTDERRRRADADREQPIGGRDAADEEADEHEGDRAADRDQGRGDAEAREAGRRQDGALAHGRDRRDARRADRRPQGRDERDDDPDDERDDDRPRRADGARLRQVDPE